MELLETRHVRDAFKAMPIKTDRNDARGIAQLMRLGWFRPVHCKSAPAQETRALLTARKLVQGKPCHGREADCIRLELRTPTLTALYVSFASTFIFSIVVREGSPNAVGCEAFRLHRGPIETSRPHGNERDQAGAALWGQTA